MVAYRRRPAALLRAWLRLLCVCALAGCGAKSKPPVPGLASTPAPAIVVHFADVAKQVGIDFVHNNGARGKKNMPETVGSGVAFLDYDNDGWQDILIVNSSAWPGDKGPRSTAHLYHNNRNGTYTDVTRESGLDFEMYGMGVAVGDFDNDGYEDIYLTAIGPNHLLRNTLGDPNRKGPIFEDVTAHAGVIGVPMPGMDLKWKWSASAAWVDYDKDGKLDLFVTQYVKWSPTLNVWCGHNGLRGYCPPGTFEGSYCTLYHNEGGGRFRDVSKPMGIQSGSLGKAFGIAVADYNGDGWPDIAVTNDTWANYLFLNEGGKKFTESGVVSGIATGESGHFKAGMGIDTADWRNNGRFALLIGNFSGESLSLLEMDGQNGNAMLFSDTAHQTGIAEPSLTFLTFGLFFFDYDLDGWKDIFTANGHVDDIIGSYDSMVAFKERPLLFHNMRGSAFQETGAAAGLTDKAVGRGAAYGDFDNDGDLDIALVDNGGQFRLYRNEGGNQNNWLVVRTEGKKSNRDGIGAMVRVTQNGVTQSQYVHSGGSFLSEHQRPLTFGLAQQPQAESMEVVWPSGIVDRARDLKAGRHYLAAEGQGIQEDPRARNIEANNR